METESGNRKINHVNSYKGYSASERKISDELLLKQSQGEELRRLEEQILKWQLDAKKWIMQMKLQQKQKEPIDEIQVFK